MTNDINHQAALEKIARLATTLELATAEPPIRLNKAQLRDTLDYAINTARQATCRGNN